MSKAAHILGMNARNQIYLKLNTKKGRQVADSKWLTKKVLRVNELPSPKLLKLFRRPAAVVEFDWSSLPDNFVLKPVSGYAGGGIIVVKKKAKWAGEWYLMDNTIINTADLRLQALDIMAGQYSLHNLPDWAMLEERIKIAKVFKKYAYQGTPDIRVVVCNRVPVMAMLRLPTAQSKGKANLHQGAIGVGIDLATGITTHAVWQGRFLQYIPGTKRKVNGLKLPYWNTILALAVRAQEAVPSLGYMGVDVVYDKEHGPVILELNARPGLEIQNANLASLRKRLQRVEGLEVRDADHGVRIAKTLFAGRFADRVMAEEGVKTLNNEEEVKIRTSEGKRTLVLTRIDTGAFRSSIDRDLAEQLGLLAENNILWQNHFGYRSAQGRQSRPVISLTFWLAGSKISSSASVADRSKMKYKFLIGRNDLEGFLVRP